jgi:hypothetical protein
MRRAFFWFMAGMLTYWLICYTLSFVMKSRAELAATGAAEEGGGDAEQPSGAA